MSKETKADNRLGDPESDKFGKDAAMLRLRKIKSVGSWKIFKVKQVEVILLMTRDRHTCDAVYLIKDPFVHMPLTYE